MSGALFQALAAKGAAGGPDANTLLLLHMDGTDGATTFTDASSYGRTGTPAGNAQIDTAQSKFGGASGLFDGSGDYVAYPDSSDWDFGTGDFTIDFWVRFASISTYRSLCTIGHYTGGGVRVLWFVGGNYLQIATANTERVAASWTPSLDTWYHVAIVRSGTTCTVYVDGTSIGSGTMADSIDGSSEGVRVGADHTPSYFHDGWIDEFRVSNVARWTANFTPPTAAYTT